MAQTLAQITKQIEKLQKEADALRQAELKGVIDRIKVAISHYGLTPDQLGFGKPSVKRAKVAKPAAKSSSKTASPRFANEDGQVWSGRGPRPRWLREALANGRSLEEFSTEAQSRASNANATSKQGHAIAVAASPAKASGTAKRDKTPTKKTDAAASKAKRPVETNPAKSARATKAPTVAVKRAPRPQSKSLDPVSAAPAKLASAPGTAVPAAAGA